MDSALKLPRTILLVENDPTLRKLLTQNLELYTGSNVIYKRDADDLVDYLKRIEQLPDLIISENRVGDEYTILKIFYYINSQELGIPIILLGENKKLVNEVTQIERTDWTKVVKQAANLMNVSAVEMTNVEVPNFYPINMGVLKGVKKAPLDLFLANGDRFTLWRQGGEVIEDREIEENLINDIGVFYVENKNRLKFAQAINPLLQQSLQENSEPYQLVTLAGESFNAAAVLLKEMGLNEEGIKAARATIAAMLRIAQSAPRLDDLMNILFRDGSSSAWQHSLLTAVVAHSILEKIDWAANQEQKGKMVFVAFFHDICIPDDRLACIHTNDELYAADLTPEERVKVERHAYAACELLKNLSDVPFGAEGIILQHHGVPSGIGFSQDHVDNRITPLAMLFCVAEDYVHMLLNKNKLDSFYIFKQLEQRYNKGHYKKAVEVLRHCHYAA